ncbi:MAG TPA: GNAT family N-acetyltransferase [Longimicrobiales bacterium]|nr:GNAT family N-acetyltransferase [Longimicrobiales bacterium]
MPVVIETPRLRLREMTEDDLDFLAAMLADEDVMRHYPEPLDREGARAWLHRQIERYERDGHGFWLVEEVASGCPVGQVGLLRQTVDGEALREVAYMIQAPYQRQGYAVEAARAVRDHAFQVLDLEEVVSFIRPENLPSQKVASRVGMEPTRMIRWAGLDHLVWCLRRDPDAGRAAGEAGADADSRAGRRGP